MNATRPSPPLRLADGRVLLPDNRWDLLGDRRPDPPATVSVVVPWFCDQRGLDLLLTGLSLQTHPADRLQVVVADDGSPDPPRTDALDPAVDRVVVRQADRGFRAAAARNLGAAAADGAVLVFLDGDMVPTPDYLAELTRRPASAADVVVTGRRRHADLTGWSIADVRKWLTGIGPAPAELPEPEWLRDLHRRTANLARLDDRSYEAVISAVLAVPADLFAAVGGFDETFVGYGGEDWDLGHRLLTVGALLAHEPAAVAWHDGADWGVRTATDPATAARIKHQEAARLAARIPGPADEAPDDARPPAVAVRVPGDPDAGAAVALALRRAGLDVAPTGSAERARVLLTLTRPGATNTAPGPPEVAAVRAAVAAVGPGRLGRWRGPVSGGWTAEALSAAAAARVRRHRAALPAADPMAALFPTAG